MSEPTLRRQKISIELRRHMNWRLLSMDLSLGRVAHHILPIPLAVAYILSELSAGPNTICAAIMHDLLEDTPTKYDDLKNQFGEEVAQMVEGVTKIGKISFNDQVSQADNHQKMLLAMSKDIRVVLIKIADRLHNMRTIHYQSPEKQLKIANETLDIYAPLAHRLGLFKN